MICSSRFWNWRRQ